jgi:hypothetical protein
MEYAPKLLVGGCGGKVTDHQKKGGVLKKIIPEFHYLFSQLTA